MTESIGDRLLVVRHSNNLSQSNMADALGIAQSTLSQFETGRSKVNASVLMRLVEDFDVSADWLLTGRGPRRLEPEVETEGIPLVDASTKVDGQGLAGFVDPIGLFDLPGFEDGTYAMFRACENTMVPTIFAGDYVVAERVDVAQLDENEITVTVFEDEYIIRRMVDIPDEPTPDEEVRLRTDHPLHDPITVSVDDVEQTWRVCGRITQTVDPYVRLTHDDLSRVEAELAQIRSMLGEDGADSQTVDR